MLPEFLNKFVISKVFADVTLASDDGITLSAHKFFPQFKFEFKSLPKSNALTSRTSTLSVANMRTKAFSQLTSLSHEKDLRVLVILEWKREGSYVDN